MQNNADSVSRLKASLNNANAEIKELERELKTASSAWTLFGEQAEKVSDRLETAGKRLSTVGGVLTGFSTAPILAIGTTAVKASVDFESSFTSVRKTVDATEEEFDELAAASKQMSTEVAASTDDINEVMAAGGQLGIATEYLTDFTRVMIDLGNSTEDLSATEAATSLAQFVNVMGTEQSKFSNIGSTVVDLGNNFATTEAEIVEMAQRLAGAGKQVGLTEAEILGFSAALSSVGISAEAGGTAFSKALINMEVAAATGSEALDDFAMVADMTADEFKALWDADPASAFMAFIEGLARMDDEGISAIATLDEIGISEVRLRDTMLRSVNATELFSNAQETANRAWEENTALTEEANKRYATTESRLTNLKNSAILFAQRIGDDLNPTINNLIDGASELIEKFMAMDESQRLQIIKFAAYAAAAGPVILILGKLTSGVGKVAGAIGKFATAVGKAGGGWSGLMTVVKSSPAFWLALAAAVVYGTYKLYDYVSGAKAAREALEQMEDAADSWKDTAAETFYGSSEGLSFFGMSNDDFSLENAVKSGEEWVDGLLKVWTDGAKETDEIVSEWTDAFTDGTDEIRAAINEQKDEAEKGGYSGLVDQMQTDLDTLDAIDAEIAALLKRRQNGLFTDEDQVRLNELVDSREAIQIKYDLVPNTAGATGFEDIRKGVAAEVARAQALGEKDADVSVYENAIVAAAEGMAEVNRQIDENYDKEFELIQMIEDADEREAAMADLNARYAEERTEAAREYGELLDDIVMPVWNSDDIQKAEGDLEWIYDFLREYSTLDEAGKQASWGDLADMTAGMDEGALTEYVTLLMTIQSLLDSGMTEEEVQALFPDIDFSAALQQLAAIQEYLNAYGYDEGLEGLSVMLGVALPEEVLTIATDLDMTGAQARWDEFAANPGAITTELIIESKVAITGYDLLAYEEFVEENPIEVKGIVRLSELGYGDDPSAILENENATFWQDGVEIPAKAVVDEMLTPETIAVLEDDGAVHVLVALDVTGSPEAIEEAAEAITEDTGADAILHDAIVQPDLSVMGIIDGWMERLDDYRENSGSFWGWLFGTGDKDRLNTSILNDFNPENIAKIAVYVSEMVAALESGEELSEDDLANFEKIIEFLSTLNETGIGKNVLAGVAEGMNDYGWDSTAETVASDLETALNNALEIHSPSRRMEPVGENAAAGIGAGMAEYDMSADMENMASRAVAAAMTALTGSRMRSVGMQAMAGLSAGIKAGRAGVISTIRSVAQAAVDAAKAALDIHSPSRVFKDEVGVMAMKGFGEGVLSESVKQAAVVRNAARYLTGEAKSGSVAPVSNDNRQTYNSDNSTTFSFAGANFNIRNEQDVRDLAVELATLTRRNQRGRGFRR